MIWALAGLICASIALPHLIPLERAHPIVGVAIWLSALVIRAVATILVVVFLVLFLPATQLFEVVTQWCWHGVVPGVAQHLEVNGHKLGDLATLAPAALVSTSAVSLMWGVARALRALQCWLRENSLGDGPRGSTIVAGREVMLAAAGLRQPRVVVSTGALTALDDQELAAGLEHERGHIAHRHRFILLASALTGVLARYLPGTDHAASQVTFHLERDADAYALQRHHDPLALASAICKAVGARPLASPATALAGTSGLIPRVRFLRDSARTDSRPVARPCLSLLAVAMSSVALSFGLLVPIAAAHGLSHLAKAPAAPHCRE